MKDIIGKIKQNYILIIVVLIIGLVIGYFVGGPSSSTANPTSYRIGAIRYGPAPCIRRFVWIILENARFAGWN